MFIIDFDDTLFDTRKFKEERLNSVLEFGVSEKDYFESYQKARVNENGMFVYTDEHHAEALAERGVDKEKVLNALKSVAEKIPYFLFPDAIEFLENLKQRSEYMVLLSLGDPRFQEIKIKACGIERYFDKKFTTPGSKMEMLKSVLTVSDEQKEIWFINDKIEETLEVSKEFPRLKAVLKKISASKEDDYQQSGLPYFENLKDISEYIYGGK